MNCEHIQNDILLEQSGELGWLGRRRLTRHLSACAACRAYRAELAAITRAAAPRADDREMDNLRTIFNEKADERHVDRPGDDFGMVVRAGRSTAFRDVLSDRLRAAR